MSKKKIKQPKDFIPKEKKDELLKAHALIQETVRFWEAKMDYIIEQIEETENMPDWMPDKEMTYHVLTEELEQAASKIAREEKEVEKLEEDTNKLLAEILLGSFKKLNEEEDKKN